MIAIVDYDMGNVASVGNMLRRVGAPDVVVTRDVAVLARADGIILPGVGAFDQGMRNLEDFGLHDVLHDAALARRVPVLGICLGMHLLGRSSEEGERPGLGLLDARAVRFVFPDDRGLKVPHMGWDHVRVTRANALIAHDAAWRFYFVHSYYVACDRDEDVIGRATYGSEFACAVNRENIYGVQFHPEKSHRYGVELLRNFVRLTAAGGADVARASG